MNISYHGYSDQNYHGYQYHGIVKMCRNVQKVPTHKSLHQVLYLKINKQQIK